jgi:hypothetical protein
MECAETVAAMVQGQLERITDKKLKERVSSLLVPPYSVQRGWDYGKPGEKLDCWMVLEHRESNTGIAYCSAGFGPKPPWGLLFLEGRHMGSGMDSAWFTTLEDAFVESWASEESETKA